MLLAKLPTWMPARMRGPFWSPNVWERLSSFAVMGCLDQTGIHVAPTQELREANSRDVGETLVPSTHTETLLLLQVPTPIMEMEISVKRVRAAAVPLHPPPLCPTYSLLGHCHSLLESHARQA